MEVFATVFARILIFVLGQIALKLFIEPALNMKKTISVISHKLILHANIYANPVELNVSKPQDVALKEFRLLSSDLHAAVSMIPAYSVVRIAFNLPALAEVRRAAKHLIGLSNGHDGALQNQGILNCYKAQKVKQCLALNIDSSEKLDPADEKNFIKAKEK